MGSICRTSVAVVAMVFTVVRFGLSASALHCPKEMLVEGGRQVTISCGLGENVTVKWYTGTTTHSNPIAELYEGTPSIPDVTQYGINEDASLIIRNNTHEQERFYTIEYVPFDGMTDKDTVVVKTKASTLHCPKEMLVEEGRQVTISCGLVKNVTVKWYTGTTTHSNPISELYEGTPSIPDGTRYGINEDASLIIRNNTHEQEMFYTIEYVSFDGISYKDTVVVKTKVSLLHCPKEILVVEGTDVTISCGLGKKSKAKWYFGSTSRSVCIAEIEIKTETLQVKNHKLYRIHENAALTIRNIHKEHGGLYTVQYFSSDGTKHAKENVILLNVKMLNNSVKESSIHCPKEISAREGSMVIINCGIGTYSRVNWYEVTNSNSSLISGINEDGTTLVLDDKLYGINEDSSLVIKDVRYDQTDIYTIEYYQSDVVKEHETVKVKVTESSIHCPEEISVREGSMVTINCGIGTYSRVSWYKGTTSNSSVIVEIKEDGTILLLDDKLYGINEDSSLVINNIRPGQADVYTIEYYQSEVVKEHETVVVKVTESSIHCPEEISVREGSMVTINCGIGTYSRVSWYKGTTSNSSLIVEIKEDGTILVLDDKLYGINEDSSLVIKSVWHDQADNYTIEYHQLDVMKEHATFVIRVTDEKEINPTNSFGIVKLYPPFAITVIGVMTYRLWRGPDVLYYLKCSLRI